MKTHCKFLILSLTLLVFIGCSKDDDGPQYSFKDQPLQGVIEGQPFVAGAGYFQDSFFEEDRFSVDIYHEDEDTPDCDFFSQEFVSVFFSVPNEVGLYKMSFNLKNFSGQTATLYDPETSQNNIVTEGAIEILSVSASETTGRIDARFDKKNHINGNFTLDICQSL